MRINFPELGENQHVEMKDINRLKWKEQKAITGTISGEDDIKGSLEFAEKVCMLLVKSGYILDDNGLSIMFPLNEETVQELPAIVVEAVMNKFADVKVKANQKN